MRQIGTLSSEASARALEDYLITREIASRVMPGDEGWEIWVQDELQLDEAKAEFETFQREPEHARYREASSAAHALRQKAEREEKQHRKNLIDVRRRWERPAGGFAPLTFTLIGISILVALLTGLGRKREPVIPLLSINSYRIDGDFIKWVPNLPDVRRGQVWRLVTPIFIHFGMIHLLFNMFWTYDLGRMIESRQGTGRLLLLVLAAAVLSNLGQYFMSGPTFGGMSGVVYALFGYVWMKGRYDAAAGLYLHPNTVIIMIGWLFLCMTGVVGHVANTAHGVGLAVGMAIGAAPSLWRRLDRS